MGMIDGISTFFRGDGLPFNTAKFYGKDVPKDVRTLLGRYIKDQTDSVVSVGGKPQAYIVNCRQTRQLHGEIVRDLVEIVHPDAVLWDRTDKVIEPETTSSTFLEQIADAGLEHFVPRVMQGVVDYSERYGKDPHWNSRMHNLCDDIDAMKNIAVIGSVDRAKKRIKQYVKDPVRLLRTPDYKLDSREYDLLVRAFADILKDELSWLHEEIDAEADRLGGGGSIPKIFRGDSHPQNRLRHLSWFIKDAVFGHDLDKLTGEIESFSLLPGMDGDIHDYLGEQGAMILNFQLHLLSREKEIKHGEYAMDREDGYASASDDVHAYAIKDLCGRLQIPLLHYDDGPLRDAEDEHNMRGLDIRKKIPHFRKRMYGKHENTDSQRRHAMGVNLAAYLSRNRHDTVVAIGEMCFKRAVPYENVFLRDLNPPMINMLEKNGIAYCIVDLV